MVTVSGGMGTTLILLVLTVVVLTVVVLPIVVLTVVVLTVLVLTGFKVLYQKLFGGTTDKQEKTRETLRYFVGILD